MSEDPIARECVAQALEVATSVLPIFERNYPSDSAPRYALSIIRAHLAGERNEIDCLDVARLVREVAGELSRASKGTYTHAGYIAAYAVSYAARAAALAGKREGAAAQFLGLTMAAASAAREADELEGLTSQHQRGVLEACRYASKALPYFERDFPDDLRPRQALEAIHRWIQGAASAEDCRLAGVAAREAAHEIAISRGGAANWGAAGYGAQTVYNVVCAVVEEHNLETRVRQAHRFSLAARMAAERGS